MYFYPKYSKFCREFIFVLKQQEKNFDLKKGYRRAACPNSNPSPNPNPNSDPRANPNPNPRANPNPPPPPLTPGWTPP